MRRPSARSSWAWRTRSRRGRRWRTRPGPPGPETCDWGGRGPQNRWRSRRRTSPSCLTRSFDGWIWRQRTSRRPGARRGRPLGGSPRNRRWGGCSNYKRHKLHGNILLHFKTWPVGGCFEKRMISVMLLTLELWTIQRWNTIHWTNKRERLLLAW